MNISSSPKIFIVIPARRGSTRLKDKLLAPLGAHAVIERTIQRAFELSKNLSTTHNTQIVCATDDETIASLSRAMGAQVVLTDSHLQSGTDRVAKAIEKLATNPNDLVINIQGDEPVFPVNSVLNLANRFLSQSEYHIGTLCFYTQSEDFFKSNVVKVVLANDQALYFSRAPVPWPRGLLGASGEPMSQKSVGFHKHLGIYTYTVESLLKFSNSLERGGLEDHEGLEQLRALSAGWKILCLKSNEDSVGIDTLEDLTKLQNSKDWRHE